jgi:hypothetical protein
LTWISTSFLSRGHVFSAKVNARMNYKGVSRWYKTHGITKFLTWYQQCSIQKEHRAVHTECFHPQVKTPVGSCLVQIRSDSLDNLCQSTAARQKGRRIGWNEIRLLQGESN